MTSGKSAIEFDASTVFSLNTFFISSITIIDLSYIDGSVFDAIQFKWPKIVTIKMLWTQIAERVISTRI